MQTSGETGDPFPARHAAESEPAGSRTRRSGPAEAVPPSRPAVRGTVETVFAASGQATRLRHLYHSGPCRVLFPRPAAGAPAEATIVTTSGGIVGGDRLRFSLAAEGGSAATVTTQAAERIYRSAGPVSEIDAVLGIDDGGFLEWVPQETILFERARLKRSTRIDIAGSGRVIAGEILVFGRRARGETFGAGRLRDSWQIRRDGDVEWADILRLDAGLTPELRTPFTFGDAAATGLLIYSGPDAPAVRDAMRIGTGAGRGFASTCIGNVMISRLIGNEPDILRNDFMRMWKALRGIVTGYSGRLPRIWTT